MDRKQTAKARPFRAELPAPGLVREMAGMGISARESARALYAETLRRLDAARCMQSEAASTGAATSVADALAHNALALFPVSLSEGAPGAITPEWLEDLHRLMRPDADHKRHGRWYTARPIARYMARRALAELPDAMRSVSVLDPACGCGALLVPLFEEIVSRRLMVQPALAPATAVEEALAAVTAADVDGDALDVCVYRLSVAAERLAGRRVCSAPHVCHGDVLTGDGAIPQADVVVMNPPYLGNRYFEALPDPIHARQRLRKAFGWNDDLYAHFLARAWDWLRPNGVLCALTSDTYLAIPSKARVRESFRAHRLREIVRVPSSAFAAAVNTCIAVAVNASSEDGDVVAWIDARRAEESAWDALEETPDGVVRLEAPVSAWQGDVPFYCPTPRSLDLCTRFLGPSRPNDRFRLLGDLAPARDCGINSGNVRHRLFHADHAPGRALLIQGRQLERYIARWDSPAAQYRYVDLNYRPDPNTPGVGRGGRTSRHGETWSFRGSVAAHTAPERILLRQTEDDLFAAYLAQDPTDPIYTDNTLFTLLLNDEAREVGVTWLYLLALLNSAFLNELYHLLSGEEGRSQAQVKVGYVNRLPIAIPSPQQRADVERWTREAICEQTQGRSLTAIQWQLDSLIERIYGVEPTR